MQHCELTHLPRAAIDLELATTQHTAYEQALDRLGFTIIQLEGQDELPDSVFVEHPAVVLDDVAIVPRPGAPARRAETLTIAKALAPLRPLVEIAAPGTLDGGDVLRIGKRLFVGRSTRTNGDGIRQLGKLVRAFGYSVVAVPVSGCLHLKSAVTQVLS